MRKVKYQTDDQRHYIFVEVNESVAEFLEEEQIEERRRKWRERKRHDESVERLIEECFYQFRNSEPDNPLDILINREESPKNILPIGINLTPKQKRVIELHYQDNLHISTIATELGISRTAVNKLLKKGLKRLREGFTKRQ